jgi:hypothetical protein
VDRAWRRHLDQLASNQFDVSFAVRSVQQPGLLHAEQLADRESDARTFGPGRRQRQGHAAMLTREHLRTLLVSFQPIAPRPRALVGVLA